MLTPLDEPPQPPPSMAFTEFPRQFGGVSFFGQPKAALRVDFVPLGTPPGGRIKAFVMADASQHFRVQAKLKELIERASSAADASNTTSSVTY
jgi:hypothetical protein